MITSSNNELGESTDKLDIAIEGDAQKQIAFNVRLLMDVLKNLQKGEIVIKLTSDTSPAVITQEDEDEYMYVLMPLRTVDSQ